MNDDEDLMVHGCQFDGTCCVCDGPAEASKLPTTALVSHERQGGRYGAIGVLLVKCDWEGHRYAALDYASEVLDPFAPPPPVFDDEDAPEYE